MKLGDIIRAQASRRDVGEICGEIVAIYDKAIVIQAGDERETVRKEGAVLVSKEKNTSSKENQKCAECEQIKSLDQFRDLRNEKKDKVCKSCRTLAIKEGIAKRHEKIGKIVIGEDEKLFFANTSTAIQLGNGFVTIDKETGSSSLTLEPTEAEHISDVEKASEIAQKWGGTVVDVITRVTTAPKKIGGSDV